MNILDIILLICFIPALISGLKKGFIAQVIAIVSIILGVWLSFRFSTALSDWTAQWIQTSRQVLNIISFTVIFVIVIFALAALGKLLEASIKIIMLGWLNKLLGVLFAFLKCLIVIGLIIIAFDIINSATGLVSEGPLSKSALYNPIKNMAYSIFPYLKELILRF